ncbi:hypothetical protein BX600DRAFT_526237 [Xylariales sp. PMI_506]|nr:hypothetical protein BX600DRAFT_526237 [Xylariales sp. PMI_506]
MSSHGIRETQSGPRKVTIKPQLRVAAPGERKTKIFNKNFNVPAYQSWAVPEESDAENNDDQDENGEEANVDFKPDTTGLQSSSNTQKPLPYEAFYYGHRCFNLEYDKNSNDPAQWDWALRAAEGNAQSADSFHTEHIFELQQINMFLEFQSIKPNVETAMIKHKYYTISDNNTLSHESSKTNNYSPVQMIVAQLPRELDSFKEFVYLDSALNGLKGRLFGKRGNWPKSPGTYAKALARIANAAMVAEYLKHNGVAYLYGLVSSRMESVYAGLEVARAPANCPEATCQFIREVAWKQLYVKWHENYINELEKKIKDYVNKGLVWAKAEIKKAMTKVEIADPEQYLFLVALSKEIERREQKELTDKNLSLNELRKAIEDPEAFRISGLQGYNPTDPANDSITTQPVG